MLEQEKEKGGKTVDIYLYLWGNGILNILWNAQRKASIYMYYKIVNGVVILALCLEVWRQASMGFNDTVL